MKKLKGVLACVGRILQSAYCFGSFLPILSLKRVGLFGSDWWEGAVFSLLISGGSRRSPAPKERGTMRKGQESPASK